MIAETEFLQHLATAIVKAGGAAESDPEGALDLARQALAQLKEMGAYAYPNLFEIGELRFVYQWDDTPPQVVVMVWDDRMWRDIARVEMPPGIV